MALTKITGEGVGSLDSLSINTTTPTNYYANDIVLTAPDEGGMTIVNGTTERAYLAFADGTSGDARYRGYLSYDHNDDTLYLGTSGSGRLLIDTNGHVTMPSQPAFLVRPTSNINNIAVGSEVTIAMGTEIFDQNGDYSSNTFTAPVTGKYRLEYGIRLQNLDTASAYYLSRISTSNRDYDITIDADEYNSDLEYFAFSNSVLADMDAGDTAILKVYQDSGTSQTDINANNTRFSGNLVC